MDDKNKNINIENPTVADYDAMADALEEAAGYEASETGEGWNALVNAYLKSDYISEDFAEACKKEVLQSYTFLIENYSWVEDEISGKDLVYNDE